MEASKATVKMLMQDHYKARMNYYQIIHKLCENLTKMSKKLLVYVNAVFEIQIFLCCQKNSDLKLVFFLEMNRQSCHFPWKKVFYFLPQINTLLIMAEMDAKILPHSLS